MTLLEQRRHDREIVRTGRPHGRARASSWRESASSWCCCPDRRDSRPSDVTASSGNVPSWRATRPKAQESFLYADPQKAQLQVTPRIPKKAICTDPENHAGFEQNGTHVRLWAGRGHRRLRLADLPPSALPQAAAAGSFLVFTMSFVTLSFLITTPECWVPAAPATPLALSYLSGPRRLRRQRRHHDGRRHRHHGRLGAGLPPLDRASTLHVMTKCRPRRPVDSAPSPDAASACSGGSSRRTPAGRTWPAPATPSVPLGPQVQSLHQSCRAGRWPGSQSDCRIATARSAPGGRPRRRSGVKDGTV